MRIWRHPARLGFVLGMGIWASLAVGGPNDTKEKLEAQKERLQEATKEEGSILEALEGLDRAQEASESKLEQLRIRQKAVELRIAGLEKERLDLEQGLAERRVQLQRRLRALYKYSAKGFLQAMLSGGSGTDILKRVKYLQLIVRKDMGLIEVQRTAIARFSTVKRELETERLQVSSLARDVETQLAAAQEDRARKKALLTRIQKEKTVASQTIRELSVAAEALARQLSAMASAKATEGAKATPNPAATAQAPVLEPRSTGGFSAQRGRLPFPAPGAKVTRAFGRYKAEGMMVYEFHRGVDFTAPMGTPFKAIYSGDVVKAEWFKGFGLLMIVDHGDGFHSIYAHAAKLHKKAGDKVKTGETLGQVGDTGSFQGPYLYLEVREKGKPVNPLEWIRVPPEALSLPP